MKLHADVRAIRRAGPKHANWFVVCRDGTADWQMERGCGSVWLPCGSGLEYFGYVGRDHGVFAIDLRTGSVHLQDESGTITEVPQSTWIAARRRRGRK